MDEIVIHEEEVFEEVHRITAYAGLKTGNVEGVASTGDDTKILNSFWNEAVASLLDVAGRYANLQEDEEGAAVLQIDVPDNWREENVNDFRRLASQYMVNAVCALWFALSLPDKVLMYQTANVPIARSIKVCLAGRKKPER